MELLIVEDGFKRNHLAIEDTLLNITVKKGVHASLLFTYAGNNDDINSNIVVEEGASLTLMMKNEGSETLRLQQEIIVKKDASLELAYCELNHGETWLNANYRLVETGASLKVKSACIVDSKKHFKLDCTHESAYTYGLMENYAVVKENGDYRMEASGIIPKGSFESATHQATRVLTMSEKQKSEVLPVLLIDENDVKASHATTVGQPDENQLYYLQTRGLSRIQALGLLTVGYLMPITELFDDVNLQEELKDEIETKVGLHV